MNKLHQKVKQQIQLENNQLQPNQPNQPMMQLSHQTKKLLRMKNQLLELMLLLPRLQMMPLLEVLLLKEPVMLMLMHQRLLTKQINRLKPSLKI